MNAFGWWGLSPPKDTARAAGERTEAAAKEPSGADLAAMPFLQSREAERTSVVKGAQSKARKVATATGSDYR